MLEVSDILVQVFFNLLIVLMPIYFYYFLFSPRNRQVTRVLAGVIFGVAAVLSMKFPVISGDVGGNFIWDLRWLPFIICVFYMGRVPGLICGLLLVSYRFYLGGLAASVNTLCVAVILFGLAVSFRRFHRSRLQRYVVHALGALVAFLIVVAAIWIHFVYMDRTGFFYGQGLKLYLIMGVSFVGGTIIYTYFTENTLATLQLMEQVHKAEKLNIVSEMAASIAHEVRNPLTVVRGFIQLTRNSVETRMQGYMDTAIEELDRAEAIISDYLNFAKPHHDRRNEEFDVSLCVQEILGLMQSYAHMKGIGLRSSIEESLIVCGDKLQFKQVLLNLLKNAIEATEQGGVGITVSYSPWDSIVQIEVADTGSGMTEEQLRTLGQPYYTTKSKGTGLGLMVTFRLIAAMGGTLQFSSKPGRGTKAVVAIAGRQQQAHETA